LHSTGIVVELPPVVDVVSPAVTSVVTVAEVGFAVVLVVDTVGSPVTSLTELTVVIEAPVVGVVGSLGLVGSLVLLGSLPTTEVSPMPKVPSRAVELSVSPASDFVPPPQAASSNPTKVLTTRGRVRTDCIARGSHAWRDAASLVRSRSGPDLG